VVDSAELTLSNFEASQKGLDHYLRSKFEPGRATRQAAFCGATPSLTQRLNVENVMVVLFGDSQDAPERRVLQAYEISGCSPGSFSRPWSQPDACWNGTCCKCDLNSELWRCGDSTRVCLPGTRIRATILDPDVHSISVLPGDIIV